MTSGNRNLLGAVADVASASARDRFARIHAHLLERICLLDYPPGMRLSEEALAREFGVSRTPLRRVMIRLESDGLVTSVHGVGTIVTDVDIGALGQTYRLRMELAELVARLDPVLPGAAALAGFGDIATRSRALAGMPDAREFARLNKDFFMALMSLTGNEPLREICERFYFRTARIWLKSISRLDLAEEVRIFGREVEDIVAALQIGDLAAAAHIRRAHISMSFTRLKANR